MDRFWELWNREYLTSLRERQRLAHPNSRSAITEQPKLGEIVLLKDEDLPRGSWKIGKILEVKKGREDQIRARVIRGSI